MAPELTWRAFFWGHFFLASLGESEKNSFAPPKVSLLLHLW